MSRAQAAAATRGSPLARPGRGQPFHLGHRDSGVQGRGDALPSQRPVLAQPEHQLLAGTEVAEGAAPATATTSRSSAGKLAGSTAGCRSSPRGLAPVCSGRQGLPCEPPGLSELLTRHHEAVLDPLHPGRFRLVRWPQQAHRTWRTAAASQRAIRERAARGRAPPAFDCSAWRLTTDEDCPGLR